ncbi:YHS domain protein [Flavobacterium jejuense]|uniref:YHS domain protein n=1 Tax=Flavobacterium jejuense TaxID=1544455 RepID=A0ABX0ISQ6_9FLAO|nr:YHS domain-containing (seleno)protein [Flavobacterium jejuense]NHN24909.1 YHS domain protein [Flavobacterium jejuense]
MKKVLFLMLVITSSFQILAQNDTKNLNVDKTKIAVEGYDVVAYFKDNTAVKGNKNFVVVDNGITYYFSSQNHKDIFTKNSTLYKPQYGGWCAYAIGKTGEKIEIDPKTFKIIDNKLYLFYNKFLTNTLKLWNKEETTLLINADKNWKTITKK